MSSKQTSSWKALNPTMNPMHFRCHVHATSLLLLLLFQISGAQLKPDDQDEILARIGPRSITERDLLERIELMPWPGKDQPSMRDSVVVNAILSLVAERLLSMQATAMGIGQDERTAGRLTALERAFARDELFRQEIAAKVTITPEELSQALQRYASQLQLAVFSVASEDDAHTLAEELASPADSARRRVPDVRILQRDTITITCGTLVRAHEDVAFSIAAPMGARASYTPSSGWLVFQLLDTYSNPAYTKLSLDDRRTTVENLLRKRRQAEMTISYYNRFMEGGQIRMDSAFFNAMADTLLDLMRSNIDAHRKGNPLSLLDGDLERLRVAFTHVLDRPFVSLREDTVTLGTIIAAMKLHPIQVRSLRTRVFLEDLNRALMTVAEAELISEWAMKRHYNEHTEVRHDLAAWMEASQTQEMVRRFLDSLDARGPYDTASTGGNAHTRQGDPLDEYIATLADKYGVEIDFQKVRRLKVAPFNMVTRRFIGFGGTLPAVPLLPHLWNWFESWNRDKRIAP